MSTQPPDNVSVGGSTPDAAGGSSSGNPTAGGSALTIGGAAYDGGGNIIVALGGATNEYGCPIAEAGAAGAENESCAGDSLLFKAIVDGATGGLGACEFVAPPGPDQRVDLQHGAVSIDATGQVVDNTGLSSGNKPRWFAQLCDRRWPCLAGMTLYYSCTITD